VVLGQLAYEWDDRETAGRRLLEGIRRDPAGEQLWPLLEGHATLARLRAAQGDVAGAREAFQQAEQLLAAVSDPRTASLLVAFRARLALAQGQVARASELLGRGAPPSGDGAAIGRETEQIARGRVLLAEGRPGDALAVLAPAGRAAEEIGRLGGAVEIRMLEALAWWRQGDTARALAALERSLALAEPEDYVRTFVDEGAPLRELLGLARDRGVRPAYAERLLAAFEERPSPRSPLPDQGAPPRGKGDDVERCPPPAPFVEPLSEREREVLRLLVAGRSGPEIARDLIVAPSTIKTHLKRIYGKLDAHSRDQAIARARELKLT
jgi:LuxR family maltose regulon positive regulatory protein